MVEKWHENAWCACCAPVAGEYRIDDQCRIVAEDDDGLTVSGVTIRVEYGEGSRDRAIVEGICTGDYDALADDHEWRAERKDEVARRCVAKAEDYEAQQTDERRLSEVQGYWHESRAAARARLTRYATEQRRHAEEALATAAEHRRLADELRG